MKYFTTFFLMFTLLISIHCSFAGTNDVYETADNLLNLSKNYLVKNVALEADESIDVKINSSDLPDRLTKCADKIQISIPKQTTRETINSLELSCEQGKPWHIYLPVTVDIFAKVVVAKHLISPGSNITDDDLDYSQANIKQLYGGYFKNKNDIMGYTVVQTIGSGSVISKRNIQKPKLVFKNQSIDLIAKSNLIEVRMKGIAKTDGSLNDTIVAYNPASKRTVEAVVVGLNRAEVIS